MVFDAIKNRAISRENNFYCQHYHHLLMAIIAGTFLLIVAIAVVLYQLVHRPLPAFSARKPNAETITLTAFTEPNLLSSTILRWASTAAPVAYTFDFVNYPKQIAQARNYFTEDGWRDYLLSVDKVLDTIIQNQLFVYGVVSGTPVISNQGVLPGKEYVWRVQIPFLVTYKSAGPTSTQTYMVEMTIVKVPTQTNPQGIGIDQFVMR